MLSQDSMNMPMRTTKRYVSSKITRNTIVKKANLDICSFVLCLTLCVMVGLFTSSSARAMDGSCTQVDFSAMRLGDGSFDTTAQKAFTIEAYLPVYDSADAQESVSTAAFNKYVAILDEQGSRVFIKHANGGDIGWVEKDTLLCSFRPLKVEGGYLERKAYIKTVTYRRGSDEAEINAVTAYGSSDVEREICPEQIGCTKLGRFELYFVMAEKNDALLLSQDFTLTNRFHNLVGWVDKNHTFPWNTSLAVRPSEFYSANGKAPDDSVMCGYRSIERAETKKPKDCISVLGGNTWFKSTNRLIVLNKQGPFYEVAAPVSQMDESRFSRPDEQGNMTVSFVDPKTPGGFRGNIFGQFKNIDVFFIIDGTNSMDPWIKAIRGAPGRPGIVQKIADQLKGDIASGANIRFGFRVYTDTSPTDEDGLGEYYMSPVKKCDAITAAEVTENHKGFKAAVSNIQVTSGDRAKRDDYPENLYGGVAESMVDMAQCRDNLKLFFVIGDAGYDRSMQKKRHNFSFSVDDLAGSMAEYKKPLFFFIRPAQSTATMRKFDLYESAWNSYRTQAMELIRKNLGQLRKGQDLGSVNPENFFIQLSNSAQASDDMLQKITANVDSVINIQMLEALELNIRNGANVREVMAQYRDEFNDVPVFIWEMLDDALCSDTPQKCEEDTYEAVTSFFIQEHPQLVEDVWMEKSRLSALQGVLGKTKTTSVSEDEMRERILDGYLAGIEDIVKTPFSATREDLPKFVERAFGIPSDNPTPLLRYQLHELSGGTNEEMIGGCELGQLMDWIADSHDMLNVVETRYNRPEVKFGQRPNDVCPGGQLTEKGKKIPYRVSDTISSVPLGDDNSFSYAKEFRNTTTIWVPREFLP
ncbi:hypothetical protein [Terasakiella sp. SH-1]|uniref:hypothetical protein n=1 Tax=Terasakiella sp. SH-1 TaxID=2560057 RepID=UPI00107323A0|nr:hypothetical protein [Terasakiella sp. SH-1]